MPEFLLSFVTVPGIDESDDDGKYPGRSAEEQGDGGVVAESFDESGELRERR